MRAMSAVGEITREAFHTEERAFDWRSGVAGAVAAVGPLTVGMAVGDPVAGFVATIGGLNTALCVPRAGLPSRLWWGGLAVAGGVASLLVADVAAQGTGALVVATLAWVGLWALWRAAGSGGPLLGFVTSAVFVIFAGLPDGAPVDRRLLWFVLGAVPGLAIMVVARDGPAAVTRRGVPREALAGLAAGVAHDRALRAHAVRLGAAVAAATLAYRLLELPHGYWVAVTTLAVLQPGEHATRVRVLQRAAGTLGGAAIIIAITLLTDQRWLLMACAAASACAVYALDRRGYFWLVVLLTPTVLFMLSAVDFQGDDVALDRVLNSSLGLVIGLVIGEAVWQLAALRARGARGGRASPGHAA
jgi:Fusaric acid resistance protein-like